MAFFCCCLLLVVVSIEWKGVHLFLNDNRCKLSEVTGKYVTFPSHHSLFIHAIFEASYIRKYYWRVRCDDDGTHIKKKIVHSQQKHNVTCSYNGKWLEGTCIHPNSLERILLYCCCCSLEKWNTALLLRFLHLCMYICNGMGWNPSFGDWLIRSDQ